MPAKLMVGAPPVIRSAQAETGVIGAAIAASVGLGLYRNVNDAAARMVARGRLFAPRKELAALFDARFAQYRQIKQAALALQER